MQPVTCVGKNQCDSQQVPGDAAAAKRLSRDDNERVLAQLLYDGCLAFDLGITAYASTAYLRATPRASLLLAGTHPRAPLPCSAQRARRASVGS